MFLLTSPIQAGVFPSLEEALAAAFPGALIEKETVFLTSQQKKEAETASGSPVRSALVEQYTATRNGDIIGAAYLDKHRVRTLPETLLVVVSPNATIQSLEILSFKEPMEYLPRRGWYEQFFGRPLDHELHYKRGISGVTGATLTGRATADAARRVLAIHQVLQKAPSP